MEFIVKKTTECNQTELVEMNDLFNEVFDKDRTLEVMMNQYCMNPLGYAYHSLYLEDGHIVGMNVYLPLYINIDGKKTLVANSIDSMIKKKHRDIGNFLDLLMNAYSYMQNEGVVLVYGYPNDNAYPIVKKGKLMKEIGMMSTYCLPYRIGGIKKGLGLLNWASQLFCWMWVGVSSVFASSKVATFKYEKDLASYNKTRYKRYSGGYSVCDGFAYKVMDFDGIRAAFLIDVFEKSPKNFCKAVRHIMKHDGSKFDILLYPGCLPFGVSGMIKIPHKYEPKRFAFMAKLLDKSYKDNALWNIRNWDTNLSNYDLI